MFLKGLAIKLFSNVYRKVYADDGGESIDENDVESDMHGVIVTNVNNLVVSSAGTDSCQAG